MTVNGLHLRARLTRVAERARGVPAGGNVGGNVGGNGTASLAATASDVASGFAGGAARVSAAPMSGGRIPLAEIIHLPVVLPELAHDPVTRTLDSSRRLTVRLVGGHGLCELLGWAPGLLDVTTHGRWQVLTPTPAGTKASRHDGRCTVTSDGRLRLSVAVTTALGRHPGDDIAVLVLPDHNAVALCPPAALLLGAPLDLLDDTNNT
jgi:hypothetical protein